MEFVRKLDMFQNKVLKKIVNCPKTTPPAILRLLTGTMPMSGRVDTLKLRYFWKLHRAKNNNAAHQIYKGLREKFLQGNQGFVHEIFNLCSKYNRMDIWHGLCPDKVNPLLRIKKIVETYHLKKDEEVAKEVKCIYTALTIFKAKKYKFDERITDFGKFKNTEHRRVFLYMRC